MISSSKPAIPYRIERANVPYHVLTFSTSWRQLPNALDKLRSLQIDVRKALITPNHSTIFIKEANNRPLTKERRLLMEKELNFPETLMAFDSVEEDKFFYNYACSQSQIELPKDTQILLYNLPDQPFTVCEFICPDRIGLLSDIIAFLSVLPIEIHLGHISTVQGNAHNMFHIIHSETKKQLTNEDVMYVSNVFEYEGKDRSIRYISPEY